MADLTITADRVGYMTADGLLEKVSAPAGEAIEAGQVVHVDPATGEFVLADAALAADARNPLVAISGANIAGLTVTAIRKGLIDLGGALDALTYDQDVYLSDTVGTLADTAGTVSTVIGHTVPAFGVTGVDKLLRVDL